MECYFGEYHPFNNSCITSYNTKRLLSKLYSGSTGQFARSVKEGE